MKETSKNCREVIIVTTKLGCEVSSGCKVLYFWFTYTVYRTVDIQDEKIHTLLLQYFPLFAYYTSSKNLKYVDQDWCLKSTILQLKKKSHVKVTKKNHAYIF